MVATASDLHEKRNPGDQVRELLTSLQEFAEAGDWQRVQATVGKLQGLLEQLPPAGRRELLLEANRSVDKIRQSANYARNEICEKLVSIRQGRKAAASYQAAGAMR
ncbi:MAG: hypothetical protein OEW68_00240 [Gammaproteobacteria bacterium]|nr:hypothetical protein [Gammaproteobacteria bacterium]MDH4313253.1 hypothetical protein [Gammaproteobacteria bacterium]MDH5213541.1 hypothetical protein [Gammaproteobacteria bacterium]